MKIIFIHIAKNCGNSFKRLLAQEEHLELISDLKFFNVNYKLSDYENKIKNLNEIYKFTIIRNPWDRLVSYFFFKKKYLLKKIEFRSLLEKKYNLDIKNISNNIIIYELKNFEGYEYNEEYLKILKTKNILQERINEIKKDKIKIFRNIIK